MWLPLSVPLKITPLPGTIIFTSLPFTLTTAGQTT